MVSVERFTASLIHAEPFQRRKSPFVALVIMTSPRASRLAPGRLPTKYERAVHADEPLPILIFPESVSRPTSPADRTGFSDVHDEAVSRRNKIFL